MTRKYNLVSTYYNMNKEKIKEKMKEKMKDSDYRQKMKAYQQEYYKKTKEDKNTKTRKRQLINPEIKPGVIIKKNVMCYF